MQEEGRARIKEDTRQDGYPSKGDEVNGEVKPQRQAREGDNDEDLQREEKNGRGTAQVRYPEHIQIDHKEAEEKDDQHRFAEDGEGALPMTQRLIFVRTAKGLENLVSTLGNDISFVDDLLPLLYQSHGRRERGQQFGLHVHRSCGIEDEVRRDLITVFGVRRLRRVDLRNGIFVLTDRDARVAFGLEPFHVLQGNDLHFALHARDIFEIRCEG